MSSGVCRAITARRLARYRSAAISGGAPCSSRCFSARRITSARAIRIEGNAQTNPTRNTAARTADELEAKILELGPDTVAAFIAETVVGSTLGCVTPAPGYFKRIREICDRYGVLLILDEVMCGMGRTGRRYACEDEGIAPDFIALAKGLSAGYLPLGALLVADKVHKAIEAGSNAVMHSHTFTGHPVRAPRRSRCSRKCASATSSRTSGEWAAC